MKIILHLGAHKTATSHLQYNLNLNKQQLQKSGVKYFRFFNYKGLRKKAIALRNGFDNEKTDIQKLTTQIKTLINREIAGYNAAIISYEGILGNLNQYQEDTIYPDIQKIIPYYKEIFKGHDLTLIFASRNYHDFLISSYKFCLKYNHLPLSVNRYLQNKGGYDGRWTTIVEHLHEGFNSPIYFFTFEDYKLKGKTIMNAIVQLADPDIHTDNLQFTTKKKNVSGRKTALDFYYTLNIFLKKWPRFKGKGIIYRWLINHKTFFQTQSGRQLLCSYQKEKPVPINDFKNYWKEVEVLKAQYGILESQ